MALLVPDLGEVKMLEMTLKDASPGNQTLHLYTNDKTPVEADSLIAYTEMTTQGYASQRLTRSNWVCSTSAGVSKAQYPQMVFTFNGTGGDTVVYGYYVTTNDGKDKLLWGERFPNAITVRNNGDQIKVTPKMEFE